MRVTQDQLYDSEATLRLVDRVLDELDMSAHPPAAGGGTAGYAREQLRGEASGQAQESTPFVRAFWEIHDALELLREGHAALRPPTDAPKTGGDDPHDRLDRALAMVDQMQGEDADPSRAEAHARLRGELLALADHLRSREDVTDRLHRTAGLLLELESRLGQLARIFDTGHRQGLM